MDNILMNFFVICRGTKWVWKWHW